MNLKEFADTIGLSQTTVSRALNGYPEVNEKTRLQVIKAAKRLNYSPNARAKSLASGRSFTIGHVLPVSSRHEMINPIFSEFVAGASEVYSARGYEMLLKVSRPDQENSVYNELWSNGAVDGLILQAPVVEDRRIGLLRKAGIPFVVHGRASGISEPYSWVDMDNLRAFRQAALFLIDLGHRRIGLINGLEAMDFAHRRRLGYQQALGERGLDLDPAIMTHSELTETYGYTSASRMLQNAVPPTAFLVASYIAAIGVRRAIKDHNLEIGRDISVIIHDDELSYFNNDEDIPLFTATRCSVRQAGKRCAELLIAAIENPSDSPVTEMIRSHLTLGKSTGPAPAGGRA